MTKLYARIDGYTHTVSLGTAEDFAPAYRAWEESTAPDFLGTSELVSADGTLYAGVVTTPTSISLYGYQRMIDKDGPLVWMENGSTMSWKEGAA